MILSFKHTDSMVIVKLYFLSKESELNRNVCENVKEHVDWRPTAAEFACDTHILGDDDLFEVVTTDLSLVSYRLPEQLFQPLKVALVDSAGRPANTCIYLMYMNIMRHRIWEWLKKNMYLFWTLYLFIRSVVLVLVSPSLRAGYFCFLCQYQYLRRGTMYIRIP